jgi:hypothetical protein
MGRSPRYAHDNPLAIMARSLGVVCFIAVAFASLGPANWLPKLLYSNNLEHFAAFYVVTLFGYAARYRSPAFRVVRDIAIFATLLEIARMVVPGPRIPNFDHWVADLGGILAAAAPVGAVMFRQLFVAEPTAEPAVHPLSPK